jgi:hypothetical protein
LLGDLDGTPTYLSIGTVSGEQVEWVELMERESQPDPQTLRLTAKNCKGIGRT